MRTIGGRYEVRRLWWQGTTSLLEAVDTVLGRLVLIRTLAHALSVNAERRGRFLDAATAAAGLDSPYIVHVLDLGNDNGDPYVVLDMPEGPSLRSIMDEPEPRPVGFRVDVITQLCEAVIHAHRHGVNQLGLRPPGIFVTDAGRVAVAPFGTVPIHGSGGTLATLVFEEVAYLAPEHVEGRVPDRRADVFTLGVIAYELIARRRPFQGANLPDLLHEILKQRPDPAPLERTRYGRSLQDVILRALAKDPEDRYAEAGAMLVDLQSLVCDAPTEDTAARAGAESTTAATVTTVTTVNTLHGELRLCLAERQWGAALRLCARLRAMAPDDPAAVVGEAAASEGRRQEVDAFRAEALAHAAEGRLAEALALADRIEARAPGDPRNALLRAYLREESTVEGLLATAERHAAAGRLSEAQAAAEEALALDPSRFRARTLIHQLEMRTLGASARPAVHARTTGA